MTLTRLESIIARHPQAAWKGSWVRDASGLGLFLALAPAWACSAGLTADVEGGSGSGSSGSDANVSTSEPDAPSACPKGTEPCEGACVSIDVDSLNCGACGLVCSGGTQCEGGQCLIPCGSGLERCDRSCVDVQRDDANCGRCGEVCAGSSQCVQGECIEVTCSNAEDCSDGETCVDGQCRAPCAGSCAEDERCIDDVCTPVCQDDEVLCGDPGTYACAHLPSSDEHCGACGRSCGSGASCEEGECIFCDPVTDPEGHEFLICGANGSERSWEPANRFCRSRGYSLAKVDGASKADFLAAEMMARGGGDHWIGGRDDNAEGFWHWTDGTIMSWPDWNYHFRPWGPGEPNNANDEDCVRFRPSTGNWHDGQCTGPHPFVCERLAHEAELTTEAFASPFFTVPSEGEIRRVEVQTADGELTWHEPDGETCSARWDPETVTFELVCDDDLSEATPQFRCDGGRSDCEDSALRLSGLRFEDGRTYRIPGTVLAQGSYRIEWVSNVGDDDVTYTIRPNRNNLLYFSATTGSYEEIVATMLPDGSYAFKIGSRYFTSLGTDRVLRLRNAEDASSPSRRFFVRYEGDHILMSSKSEQGFVSVTPHDGPTVTQPFIRVEGDMVVAVRFRPY